MKRSFICARVLPSSTQYIWALPIRVTFLLTIKRTVILFTNPRQQCAILDNKHFINFLSRTCRQPYYAHELLQLIAFHAILSFYSSCFVYHKRYWLIQKITPTFPMTFRWHFSFLFSSLFFSKTKTCLSFLFASNQFWHFDLGFVFFFDFQKCCK